MPTGFPIASRMADRAPALGRDTEPVIPPAVSSGIPAPRYLAISAGGGPNVGLPTLLTDLVLGIRRLMGERIEASNGLALPVDAKGVKNSEGLVFGIGSS